MTQGNGLGMLRDAGIARRIVERGRLRPKARSRLWSAPTGWELRRHEFVAMCPQCWLEDLERGRALYGRQCWQQAWRTICRVHRLALRSRGQIVRSGRDLPLDLKCTVTFVSPSRIVVSAFERVLAFRKTLCDALFEIEEAAAAAITGVPPPRHLWGALKPDEFLRVLMDLTTWALTHFEPVRSWSAAEELTSIERIEGSGIVGRYIRLTPWSYGQRRATRTLADVHDPTLRGSALWLAHTLMATRHRDASDRATGARPQDRQRVRLSAAAPAGLEWLAHRMRAWPHSYRRHRWIDVRPTLPAFVQTDSL